MRWFYLVLILLLVPLSTGFMSDEAKEIFSSQELILTQTISGGVEVSNAKKPLNFVEATFNYYPEETYRQSVIDEFHTPDYSSKKDGNLVFKVKDVDSDLDIQSVYTIKTHNEYKKIKSRIPFPLKDLPNEYNEYLESSELIDVTDEIRATASTIASGKDDLFEVSMDVANWVVGNIEYDLVTVTEESSQKASWVMENRKGVCDELSIIYISLMRSLGVPARFVTGISYTTSDLFESPWSPHAWTEVYFPGYGWVPFDLTYNQFGFIDASHVQFKATPDVSSISTGYQWKGYDLDEMNIDILNTEFGMEVKDSSGKLDQGFDVDLSLTDSAVGFGSYDVLKINLVNRESYYVSSYLHLAMPPEVTADRTSFPIYLKPKESKTLYVLLEVTSRLDSSYIYTMPISVYTALGESSEISFKVASKYNVKTLDQVNSYLTQNTEDRSDSEVVLDCSFDRVEAALGQEVDFICTLKNDGNTYLTDGDFCLGMGGLKSCDDLDLTIGGTETISKKITFDELGKNKVDVSASFNDLVVSEVYEIIIVDSPSVEIDFIDVPLDFKMGEDVEIIVGTKKESDTNPENLHLDIEINGNNYAWDITELTSNTDFKVPFSSYLFVEGSNSIVVDMSWEDSDGKSYDLNREESFELEDFSLSDKIKSFFYRLIN